MRGRTPWDLLRVPLVLILTALLPVIEFLSGAVLVLGLFVAVLLEVSAVGPTFPFWKVVAVIMVASLLGILYVGVITHLVQDER